MEAVPRLPMIGFETKTSTENTSFGQPIKQYIGQFYGEDPETYNNELHNLESLRGGAVRPSTDVEGIQLLKKYFCQLHYLKSRFPMEELQPAAVYFSWKDNYSSMACSIPDIRLEMMCILYNIGALHSQLGAQDTRTTPDGMKMACTHFQCAAWAFKVIREEYHQMVTYMSSVEVAQFMELVCLAQAQECILEKSMMDNRKATIIAKVAVQVVDFYRRAQTTLQGGVDENNYSDYVQVGVFKEWVKYLNFKIAYHKCITLLYRGQEAEEQQKMGERVALYQAAAEQLEVARKLSGTLDNKQDIGEALAFTFDFVEGKKKAAKNENDFIYHEEVPNKDTFQELKGASLVKGIPFAVNDPELSGPDIFARLVPMEAHEASSLYSEKKAELLRKYGELIDNKDQKLTEFMSSMQIEFLGELKLATGLPQEIVDRAAALSAKQHVIQELVSSMTKLSNTYHDVESLLDEIQELVKEEEKAEKEYQTTMGERPPSIVATDLAREAAKYREAHNKANDSNQNLHRAMVTHVNNLKTLAQPLTQLQHHIPSIKFPDSNVDDASLQEIEQLLAKVEEMKTQRAILWAQLRDSLHKDDITGVLVTRQANQSNDDVFQQQLEKHKQLTTLIEQNIAAQENIIKAFIDAYAKFSNTRRYLQGIVMKRQSTVNALIASYDSYEDLLSKANKGIEFYAKLETNVTKLLQRVKSSCKVQQEEREQMLSNVNAARKKPEATPPAPVANETMAPKLKDYLASMKKNRNQPPAPSVDNQFWPPGVRPAPVGSEIDDAAFRYDSVNKPIDNYYPVRTDSSNPVYYPQQWAVKAPVEQDPTLEKRFAALSTSDKNPQQQQYPAYYPTTPYQQPVSNQGYDDASSRYAAQYTQYVPNQYQQPVDMVAPPTSQVYNAQPSSNQDYASGYATAQNFQTSGLATVQSVGQVNYASSSLGTTAYPQNVNNYYGYPTTYGTYQTPSNPQATYYPPQSTATLENYDYNSYGYAPTSTPATITLSQYSEGYVGAGSLTAQDQLGLQSMYTQAGVYAYQPISTPSSNGGLASPQDYNTNYPTNYNYPAPEPKKESSTLDLLTGLDFSISQVPLEPQQKKIEPTIKPVVAKPEPPRITPITNKEEQKKPEPIVCKVKPSKSLTNSDTKRLFTNEIDKYEKFVDVLSNKTLNGPTNLDLKWKEVQDAQDGDATKKIISVARCYPMKNRFPDILPYDHSRVVLTSTANDYINASFIKDISLYVPPLIVTQTPLPSTLSEFWTMILEQRVELVMCIVNESEIDGGVYWPTDKGRDITLTNMIISLQSCIRKQYWIERLITITIPEKRESVTIMHLQYVDWSGGIVPTTVDPFVLYIREFINLLQHQRVLSNPVVVHCCSGIGRSGVACLLLLAILEATNNPTTLPDLTSLTNKITSFKKNILRDREHLKFSYKAFLLYMKQIINNDLLNDITAPMQENVASVSSKEDPLSSLDPFWASRK